MGKGKKRKKHRMLRRILLIQFLLLLLVVGGVAFYFIHTYGAQVTAMQQEAKRLVEHSSKKTFRAAETSLVFDDNGNQITAMRGEKDVYYLPYEEIPAYAKAAMISTEDKKFETHRGYDLKGILRAAISYLKSGQITQGGSTITQQLARNTFLTQERTWQRKAEEILIAVELEKKYSKEQIMEFYLNNIYFGNGYYGIQAASKGYFSKDVQVLSLSEIAFLCAIPNSPNRYDPVEHMDATLKRRNRILKQMKEDGKISKATCQQAMEETIELKRAQRGKSDYVETYTYYCATRALMEQQGFRFRTEFDSEEEEERYQEEYSALYGECQASLYQKGYRIYTSVNLELQQKLQAAVDGNLAEFGELSAEGIYALQGAAVCIDNHTGMVKAIVGGRDQSLPGYTLNRAYQSYRQPGSAIKPLLVYTPMLERGYTPDSVVVDAEIPDGPQNADGVFSGEMTLRQAVEQSKNTVAWSLFQQLTPERGLEYLRRMNFARLDQRDVNLAAALGGFTKGASPLEMAAGFAALENDGNYRQPTCISRITDAEGAVVYEASREAVAVYEQNAARMMTELLTGVLTEGTGSGLALSQTVAAGKTGTTNDKKDGWFVGYTPYYTTSVWVGYDLPRELPGLFGSTYPGRIWHQFMEEIHQGQPPMEFLPYIRPGEQGGEEEPEPMEEMENPQGWNDSDQTEGMEDPLWPDGTDEAWNPGEEQEASDGTNGTGTQNQPGTEPSGGENGAFVTGGDVRP